MKVIFFGATKFSEDILTHLLNNKIDVAALFTIPQEFSISYSNTKVKNYNYSELEIVAAKNNIPYY